MDLPTLERWIVRAGYAVEAENATTVRLLHGDAALPPFFVQLSEHWVLLSMLPLSSAGELGVDQLGRRLLEANREMRVAKFAIDAEGAVVLCAELPTESLDESELVDAVRRVVHYGKDLRNDLQGDFGDGDARTRRLAAARAMLDAAPDAFVAVDDAGRVAFTNVRAEAIFGYGRGELIGRPIEVLLVDLQMDEGASAVVSLATARLRGRRRDGSEFPIAVSLGRGSFAGAVLVVQDVTATQELERLRAERRSAVAHDLRAPLNVIALSSQLLLAGIESPAEHREIASRVLTNAQEVGRMIGDLADLFRLEAARAVRKPVDVVASARASVEAATLEAKGRPIELRVAAGVPRVAGDPAGLERVLGVLLANALHHGREGAPIVVEVSASGDVVTVAVTNEGDWISADAKRARGLGLGLHVAREIVEAHGARLEAESTPGATTFRFTLSAG